MKNTDILLVEDNEGDILLTLEVLQSKNIMNKINVVNDGKKAIQFLNREGDYANMELPGLILLDINLPKKNGHEVLQYIKSVERLKYIPVIILTTSSSGNDISKSYQNNVSCYLTKPLEIDEFLNSVKKLKVFPIYMSNDHK